MDAGVLRTVQGHLTAEIHPALLGQSLEAAREKLSSLVLKWQPQWEGAILAYSGESLEGDQGLVLPFLPYVQLRIVADLLLFKPTVGCALVGKVQKVGSDYVSMLVLGVFNAVLFAKDMDKKYLPLASGALADGDGAADADGGDAKKKKKRRKRKMFLKLKILEILICVLVIENIFIVSYLV
mmetsp:Transcript_22852/g.48312  ORF Transcript_22852/g.48312 Transcript_22852/m.48312 type:complete len:182 (+) Transcript_22852:148-693(+)